MQSEQLFRDFIISVNKDSFSQMISKNPHKTLEKYGFSDFLYLIGETYEQTRTNLYEFAHGPSYCKCCGNKIQRIMPGWNRGWYLTCSEECRQSVSSERQKGDGNSSHNMTDETRQQWTLKISSSMKESIRAGKFTPKTNNYKNQRPIKYYDKSGNIVQVRSLWELIYRLNFPDLLYEQLRILYFDNIKQKERVYITDFYDPATNTIIEIRPKAYQPLLCDKQKAVLEQGYNYVIVDEDYFNTQKTPSMIKLIESVVCNYDDVRGRLKWLKKVK